MDHSISTRNARGRAHHARFRTGFTLIETALAIVIISTGVLAMMAAQQAFHQQNRWSTHASTATWLANEIREMTLNLPRYDPVTGTEFWGPEPTEAFVGDFDDVDDFDGTMGDGVVFAADLGNGPLNARREIISNMEGWSQTVLVHNVDPFDISAPDNESLDGTTDMVKITVIVSYQGPNEVESSEVIRMSWITPN